MKHLKLHIALVILFTSSLLHASQNEWHCRGRSERDVEALERVLFEEIRYDGGNGFFVPVQYCDITRDLFNRQVCEADGLILKVNILKESFLLTPQGERIIVRCKMLRSGGRIGGSN